MECPCAGMEAKDTELQKVLAPQEGGMPPRVPALEVCEALHDGSFGAYCFGANRS